MTRPTLESIETRTTLDPFFHMGILVNGTKLTFSKDARDALGEHIKPLIKELKEKEKSAHSHLAINEIGMDVVEGVEEFLQNEIKGGLTAKLKRRFDRILKGKGKKKDVKKVEKIVNKEIPHFSYLLPIEYLDINISSQRFPVELILRSTDTIDSIMQSLQSRTEKIPSLTRNQTKG